MMRYRQFLRSLLFLWVALAVINSFDVRANNGNDLYNLGARYYDPMAGHFLSADPLGHAASMDLHSFCNGDPINRFDPTGRFAKDAETSFGMDYNDIKKVAQGFASGLSDTADSSGTAGYGGFISQTGGARINAPGARICRRQQSCLSCALLRKPQWDCCTFPRR